VQGDDGFPVEEVGSWSKEKHHLLCKYVDITRAVRRKWLSENGAGATYIDVFCGPGRAQVRKTGKFIDGSCVAAWKQSVKAGAPFSTVYVADVDPQRCSFAVQRLSSLGAPVVPIRGDALVAARAIVGQVNPYGLHFAFLDPWNLGELRFEVIRTLSPLRRIDMLIHVSKMDLQRNLGFNITGQQVAFDQFAPGWRAAVNMSQSHQRIRVEVFDYWRRLVEGLGLSHSPEMRLVKGSRQQHLYWLLLVAKHDLAAQFWKSVAAQQNQPTFL